jgi:hypothetical protein
MPSGYAIAIKAKPSCSPMSQMVEMLGWLRAEAAWASRAKRVSTQGSPATSSERNFGGDKALQADVFGLVDHPHPAAGPIFPEMRQCEMVCPIIRVNLTSGKVPVNERRVFE